jgi:hypothetical protein
LAKKIRIVQVPGALPLATMTRPLANQAFVEAFNSKTDSATDRTTTREHPRPDNTPAPSFLIAEIRRKTPPPLF